MIQLREKLEARAFDIVVLTAIFMSSVSFAAWATHVVVCFRAGNWAYLIAGAVAFPVGVVHGSGIWFGLW